MVNSMCNYISSKRPHFFVVGDMVYFEVLGQSFLALDTLERTNDLFEKRSTNYSDRTRMPMILEL